MKNTILITSLKDPRIAHARLLTTTKGRGEHRKCLLEGTQQIAWAQAAGLKIHHIFISNKLQNEECISTWNKLGIDTFILTEGLLKKITDTSYIVPFVGVCDLPIETASYNDFVVILDNIVDHGNRGTLVRTARAFGIHDIIAIGGQPDFFYKKTIDASRGTVFSTNLVTLPSTKEILNKLKKQGYQIIATSPRGTQIQALVKLPNKPVALVVGNETTGCTDEILNSANMVVQIPMDSEVESLNVAVAAAMSMYELKLKMVIAMLTTKIRGTLGRQMSVAVKLIQHALDVELQQCSAGVTANQLIFLMILKCDQFMTLQQITRDTGVADNELKSFLESLITSGYIQQQTEETRTGVILTNHGEELIAKLWPLIEHEYELTGFSDAEKAQLFDYIMRIQSNCEMFIKSFSDKGKDSY